MTKLLTDLNVMESTEPKDDTRKEEDYDEVDNNGNMIVDQQQQFAKSSGYSEYENDVESDLDDSIPIAVITEYEDDEGHDYGESEQVRHTPLFLHLTAQLSFSEENAERACHAIENWQVPASRTDANQTLDALDDQLALAMDWLCLHLTDAELKAGFEPNSTSITRRPTVPSHEITRMGLGRTRPIPHSSISVANPITTDREWRDTLRRQARKVRFLRLGFNHVEAEKACDETMHVSEKVNTEDDEEGLRILLSLLERETLGKSFVFEESSNQTDLGYATSEREQEIQALEAIFDDQFEVRRRDGKVGFDRYLLSVTPVVDLNQPCHSEECKLHVMVRPEYPVLSPPLFLFTNPTFPPSLLRRINISLIHHAHERIGEPSIFAVMDFLSSNLHEMQINFIKEQCSKELEAEQLRMRTETGHDLDAVIEARYEDGSKIGRRQKAKLRAAEKSFDRSERLQQREIEWRQQQEKRLERVKSEQMSLRLTMAERAVAQRAQQRIAEEAECASRKAMNAAFNRGESVEEARAAARKARNKSLRRNGEDMSNYEEEADDGPMKDDPDQHQMSTRYNEGKDETTVDEPELVEIKQTPSTSQTTPATMAFMERLRQCYNNAVHEKSRRDQSENLVVHGNALTREERSDDDILGEAKYHFADPVQMDERQEDDEVTAQSKKAHIPMPVPVPTGALKDVMKDVIKSQNEQPWLIAPEARVPTVATKVAVLTPELCNRRNQISTNLRNELGKKNKVADSWATNNCLTSKTNGKGLSQQVQHQQKISLQRQRLPAYMMRNEIVETIASDQITVISGDTGKPLSPLSL